MNTQSGTGTKKDGVITLQSQGVCYDKWNMETNYKIYDCTLDNLVYKE